MRNLLFLILIIPCLSKSQVNPDYNRLKCEGLIPNDFTQLSTIQYERDYGKNEDADLDADFFVKTRFYTDELLQSGTVLFNTPHSNYITEIAKYLLRDNSTLFNELRFYIVRSNVVNAYSTDQGIIIFTTGILAHIENEAQLSFIIAHEISHYIEKHVRKGYIEYKDFTSSIGNYRRTSYFDALNRLSLFNKQQELDADAKGIELYLESYYDPTEIENAFYMLQFGDLPFDDQPFDIDFLATKNLILPHDLFPDSIVQIDIDFDFNDDYSTHPNIKKRIDAAQHLIGDNAKNDYELYHILTKAKFKELQKLVRFESVNIDLADRYYGDALYSTFLLLREYPNNRFLESCKVKALYGLAKYKNNLRFDEVTTRLKNVQGESYTLHYFLRLLSQEQLNVITYRHLYDMVQKYPQDVEFLAYFNDFEKEFILNSQIDFKDLKSISLAEVYVDTAAQTIFDLDDSIRKIESSEHSKLEKIRLKKELYDWNKVNIAANPTIDFHLYGLADLVKDKDFISNLLIRNNELTKEKVLLDSLKQVNEKKIKSQGYHFGINSVMVIDPVYNDYKLNGENNYLKSESRKIEISNTYSQKFKRLDLKVQILNSKALSSDSVDAYNDLALIKDWKNEVNGHDGIEMLSSVHFQMAEIRKKYGVSNFLFSGITSYVDQKELTGEKILIAGTVYLAPLVLFDLLMVHNNFTIVSYLIDSESDVIEMVDLQDVNLNATPKVIRSYIYNLLIQINSAE